MKLAAFLLMAIGAGLAVRGQATGLKHGELTVVASNWVGRGATKNELTAALKVWVEVAARRRGIDLQFRFEIAESQREIQAKVDGGKAGLFMMDVFEYLRLGNVDLLKPVMAFSDQAERSFVLVTRAEEVGSLEQLRGKPVLYYSWSNAELGRKWLEVTLRERGLPRASQFLNLQAVGKVSAACLPVFFGKADGCIVDAESFRLLKEMNPQMGRKLKVILESPVYTESILAMHANYQSLREDLIRGLMEAHDIPEGRQIMTIFRASRVRVLDAKAFATARALKSKYDALHLEPETGKGMPGGGAQ